MKKDNKGFSLVELIVVVLIMGILAVALTPQVLKWVNRSRVANDFQLAANIETATEVALTNEKASALIPTSGTMSFTVKNNGSSATTLDKGTFIRDLTAPLPTDADDKFEERFKEALGVEGYGDINFSAGASTVSGIKVTVYSTGRVTTAVLDGSSRSISSPDSVN